MPWTRRGTGSIATVALLLPLAVLSGSRPASAADPPILELPLACRPGTDCWAVLFPDLDPGPGARDWMCGARTYDGHQGTDIAIPDLAAMRRGVPVLAAAPGVVAAVRDGMPDIRVDEIDRRRIAGRECGNGVLVDHGDGFETQYCHLRRGSVQVRPGESVGTGTALGLVGLSGETNFPHLEFLVRYRARSVDPYRGLAGGPSCGAGRWPLWSKTTQDVLGWAPVLLAKLGVAAGRPEWRLVREGGYGSTELPVDSPALVLWVEGYGLEAGDLLAFEIRDPSGALFHAGEIAAEARQGRFFRYHGRRRPASGLRAGSWSAEVRLLRRGRVLARRQLAFDLR